MYPGLESIFPIWWMGESSIFQVRMFCWVYADGLFFSVVEQHEYGYPAVVLRCNQGGTCKNHNDKKVNMFWSNNKSCCWCNKRKSWRERQALREIDFNNESIPGNTVFAQSSHQRPTVEDTLIGNALNQQINTQQILKRCIKWCIN